MRPAVAGLPQCWGDRPGTAWRSRARAPRSESGGRRSRRRKACVFLHFTEKGLLPVPCLATAPAAPDPERQDDFLKLVFVFFFPFFLSSLLFLPRPDSSPRQDAECAAPRSSAWPPAGARRPTARAPRAAGPPLSASPAGPRRHARRGAPAARGLGDYAEAELLGPAERGPRARWGAGCGTPAEDGWPRLRAPTVRARPPAAAAVRPGHGQPPRGRGHGRTPAHLGLAGPSAAGEVHGRPQPPPAPG